MDNESNVCSTSITEERGCDKGTITESMVNGLKRRGIGMVETIEIGDCDERVELDDNIMRLGGGSGDGGNERMKWYGVCWMPRIAIH